MTRYWLGLPACLARHGPGMTGVSCPCLFQDGCEFEVVPGSEFSVARTAHRSNQSDYYISDRKVSAKEVAERLKSKGIDLDNNRFLILQVRQAARLS